MVEEHAERCNNEIQNKTKQKEMKKQFQNHRRMQCLLHFTHITDYIQIEPFALML